MSKETQANTAAGRPLRILVTADALPEVLEQAAGMSPQILILKEQDLKETPSLIGEIEIVYGCLDQDQWSLANNLKWLQFPFAGADDLLIPEVIAHPVVITAAHIHAVPISEHLFGMLLMLTRGLHIAYRQQLGQKWDRDSFPQAVHTLPGKTLGVVGLGAVGRRTAQLGAALGMRVVGLDQKRTEVAHVETVYTPRQKHQMLAECDYIMVTLPLTSETRCFISRPEFEVMKPGALLFNAGRGGTIDTDALVDALRTGKLGGAGLDATDPEPLPADHPLWTMPNVIITPHYAGMYPNHDADAGKIFLDNLRRYLAGEPLLSIVDKEAGY